MYNIGFKFGRLLLRRSAEKNFLAKKMAKFIKFKQLKFWELHLFTICFYGELASPPPPLHTTPLPRPPGGAPPGHLLVVCHGLLHRILTR